jgi:hypothetical protein
MIKFKTQEMRSETYASSGFVRDVADILQRPSTEIRLYSKSLIDGGMLPASAVTGAAAVAVEGSRILSAALGRQVRPASVVRVTSRILAMEHQGDLENMGMPAERSISEPSGETFETRLARTLRETWEATERPSGPLPAPTNITLTWDDGGTVLYGTVGIASKVTAVYSSASIGGLLALPGPWCSNAVGGAAFTFFALLGMAEQIRDAARADER